MISASALSQIEAKKQEDIRRWKIQEECFRLSNCRIYQYNYKELGVIAYSKWENAYDLIKNEMVRFHKGDSLSYNIVKTDELIPLSVWERDNGQRVMSKLLDPETKFYEVVYCYGFGHNLNIVRTLDLIEIAKKVKDNVFDKYAIEEPSDNTTYFYDRNFRILEEFNLLGLDDSKKIFLFKRMINEIGRRNINSAKADKRRTWLSVN